MCNYQSGELTFEEGKRKEGKITTEKWDGDCL